MRNKEFKRHIAYEVLTILGTLALLLFVCRLWPILLLVILGIFIAAMRLLFLSARKVENIPPLLPAARPEPTDQDIRDMAFGSMQRRITELVTADFPNARWVWKTPNAMRNIATGNEVRILLNHAGGYREAIVVIRGLQVCSLTYYVTLFLNICSILRESNIIHKKIRNYLEEKRCPITKCSFRSIFLKAGSLCAYSFFS